MKPPAEIAARLTKQWHQSALRVERLLSPDVWPLEFSIGKPTGARFAAQTAVVQAHVQAWLAVKLGEVEWEPVKYRAGADAVSIPVRWRIRNPSEWVAVCADATVQAEFAALEHIIAEVDALFREVLIRDRYLWKNKDLQEVVATAGLAASLLPGAAKGRPLRLMAGLGVDTKFFERNAVLLTRLLDERYQGAVGEQGLQAFLDAYDESEHWVLVVALDRALLPFRRQRVTTGELAEMTLPGSCILVVENERCVHLLPDLPDTLAILGAGMDLQWLQSVRLETKSVAYWGDMDSWGLVMLARARQYRPNLKALLMNRTLFDQHATLSAVSEPVIAQTTSPEGLTDAEAEFYTYLVNQQRGRLEQEFLPKEEVETALNEWIKTIDQGV